MSTDAAARPFEALVYGPSSCAGEETPASGTSAFVWADLQASQEVETGIGKGEDADTRLWFTEAELARLCSAVAWRTRQETLREAEDRELHRGNRLLEQLVGDLSEIAAERDRLVASACGGLARLLHAMLHRLLPALLSRFETQEVALQIRRVLEETGAEDEVVIRVAPPLAGHLERLLERNGRGARFRVEADAALEPAAYRLEVPSGFLERSPRDVLTRIEELLVASFGSAEPAFPDGQEETDVPSSGAVEDGSGAEPAAGEEPS